MMHENYLHVNTYFTLDAFLFCAYISGMDTSNELTKVKGIDPHAADPLDNNFRCTVDTVIAAGNRNASVFNVVRAPEQVQSLRSALGDGWEDWVARTNTEKQFSGARYLTRQFRDFYTYWRGVWAERHEIWLGLPLWGQALLGFLAAGCVFAASWAVVVGFLLIF